MAMWREGRVVLMSPFEVPIPGEESNGVKETGEA